jgi:hypothetical protein
MYSNGEKGPLIMEENSTQIIIKWLRYVWDRRQNAVLKKRGMLALDAVWVIQQRR